MDYNAAMNLLINTVTQNLYSPGYVEQHFIVLDLGMANLYSLLGNSKELINKISIVYAGRLAKMCIINMSFILYKLYNICESMLGEDTKAKIKLFSQN